MKNLIEKALEGGPLAIALLSLDVVIACAVLVLAIFMRRRIARISHVMVVLAVISSLLSMGWTLLYISDLTSQEEWTAHRPAKLDSDLVIDPVGQILGTVDIVRIILSAGFGAALLCLVVAYGFGSPRGRVEHAIGMVIGGVFAVIAGTMCQVFLRIGARYSGHSGLPHPPPPPASDAALGSYNLWGVSISAVALIASVAFVLFSFRRWRCAPVGLTQNDPASR
jgi:hypothetical protein